MTEKRYLNIIRYWAWYDLFLTILLALPLTALLLLWLFQNLHGTFNLIWTFQDFDPIHIMFVNLMWIISVFWALLRIKHTSLILGLYDSYMRLWIAFIIAIYILYFEVSIFFISFVSFEFILGVIQIYFGSQIKKETK